MLQVHLSQAGSGLTVDDTLDLYCGEGEQILQWVGYTACSRLAYKRGAHFFHMLTGACEWGCAQGHACCKPVPVALGRGSRPTADIIVSWVCRRGVWAIRATVSHK